MSDPVAILNQAATLIETRGWHQGDSCRKCNPAHTLCLEDALAKVEKTEGVIPVLAVAHAIHAFLDLRIQRKTLSDWNDEPGRTKEDVVKMLRALAGKLQPHTGDNQ